MSRFDMPIENPRKYGVWEDGNLGDVSSALDGGNRPGGGSNAGSGPDVQTDDEITPDFLRQLGNNPEHYGK